MKDVRRSGRFQKDLRLAAKRRLELKKLEAVLDLLMAGKQLPASYRDHMLLVFG
jgi:mRNA interferase YafQ